MRWIVIIWAAMSYSAPSMAAHERGGGNAVVCRDQAGAIKSAELLDLWEGRIVFGETHLQSPLPYRALAEDLADKLVRQNRREFEWRLPEIFKHVLNDMRLLAPGVVLTPIADSFPYAVPKDCAIEQLAAYLPSGDLLVNSDIWTALPEIHKAGLVIHETIYKYLRETGSTDSLRSRRIVSWLLAGLLTAPAWNGYGTEYQCADYDTFTKTETVIWGYTNQTDRNLIDMYISQIKGVPVISKKMFTIRRSILEAKTYDAEVIRNFEGTIEPTALSYFYFREDGLKPPYKHEIQLRSPFGEGSADVSIWLRCLH